MLVTWPRAGVCDTRYFPDVVYVFIPPMATLPLTTPTVIPDAALLRRMAQRDATALVELQRRYGGVPSRSCVVSSVGVTPTEIRGCGVVRHGCGDTLAPPSQPPRA